MTLLLFLQKVATRLYELSEDERVHDRLIKLTLNAYIGKDYVSSTNDSKITAGMINDVCLLLFTC